MVIIGNMNFPPPFQATTKILISLATHYRAFPIFLLMKNFCLPILIGFVGVHITNYFLDLYCVSQHRFITHRISQRFTLRNQNETNLTREIDFSVCMKLLT